MLFHFFPFLLISFPMYKLGNLAEFTGFSGIPPWAVVLTGGKYETSGKLRSKSSVTGACVQPLLDGMSRGHKMLDNKQVSTCVRKEVGILTSSLYRNGRHRNEKFYRVLKKVCVLRNVFYSLSV